jgi:hypothetical protein
VEFFLGAAVGADSCLSNWTSGDCRKSQCVRTPQLELAGHWFRPYLYLNPSQIAAYKVSGAPSRSGQSARRQGIKSASPLLYLHMELAFRYDSRRL